MVTILDNLIDLGSLLLMFKLCTVGSEDPVVSLYQSRIQAEREMIAHILIILAASLVGIMVPKPELTQTSYSH